MNIKPYIFILVVIFSCHCHAGATDTAFAKTANAPEVKRDSVAAKKVATAPSIRMDTAVVRSYNGIPVFYHCTPLHKYTRLGYMTRAALVPYLTNAFERYTRLARRHAQGRLGILIDDMNFGTDSFDVVRFSPQDGNADTALFSTPIFVSAKPTRPYKVIRILRDLSGTGSLNSNLQAYMQDAQDLHVHYDGIMLRDINYLFGSDNIFVFRWKKPSEIMPIPPPPASKVTLAQDKK